MTFDQLDTIDDDEIMTVAEGATLQNLEVIINKAATLKSQINSLEAALKAAKRDLQEITTRTLPDAMQAASTDLHRTTRGVMVEVMPLVSVSLPKEETKRNAAIQYLSIHAPELLKTKFAVELGKGSHNMAAAVQDALERTEAPYSREHGVHAATLKAWVKEKVRKGADLDLDLLGAFVGRYAKITLPDGTKIGGEAPDTE